MFTEPTYTEQSVTAWLLDQIEANPGITSTQLADQAPGYMKPRSVAPALTKLTTDQAVRRERRRTEARGSTFAYWLLDRDMASASLTAQFRHMVPGSRPKGAVRNRKHDPALVVDQASMDFSAGIGVEERRAAQKIENMVTARALSGSADWVGVLTHRTKPPALKLLATMEDGTQYDIQPRHARELVEALRQL